MKLNIHCFLAGGAFWLDFVSSDKYFGKDLFERKPLIRSIIEEELFRLTEEAEKKELEEEELAEAKDRAEQTAKEMAQVQTVESGIEKLNLLQAVQMVKLKTAQWTQMTVVMIKGSMVGLM